MVEKKIDWHVHSNPIINEQNTSISVSKRVGEKVYEIQFLPTISLSVWSNSKEELKKIGTNHKILGVLQINSEKDFDTLWNAIYDMLKDNDEFFGEE